MNFVSIRIVTTDVDRLTDFYERVTGTGATRFTPDFAELTTGVGTIAISGARLTPQFAPSTGGEGSVIIELLVDDVDAVHQRLDVEVLSPPTTMPWGNRSMLLRDPDGNPVNLFTPVTPEAVRKFARFSAAA